MESENTNSVSPQVGQSNSWSKEDKKKNKKLRHAGLEYVSRSGRTIAAKKQPDVICNCPQQCSVKVPKEVRERLFADFYALADANSQNAYLQRLIEIRSVNKRLYNEERKESGRLQRRVTCKYSVPVKLGSKNNADTPTENGVLPQNDISRSTDVGMPSEESDNEEEKTEIDGELDGDESGNEIKHHNKDSTGSDPDAEKVEDNNGPLDTHDTESPSLKNHTENKDTSQIPVNPVSGERQSDSLETKNVQTEESTPNLNTGNKENEVKSESFNTSKEDEPKLETAITPKENEAKSETSVVSSTQTTDKNSTTSATPKPTEQKEIVEVCQKAFMNIFAITEKRVRLQRERIIDDLRYIAEKRKAEQEEMENTISVARELAAGCRPLLYFMDKSNQTNKIPSLPNKLLVAIDNDLNLVNNFFRNQLWKPEHFSKRYKCDDMQPETEILD